MKNIKNINMINRAVNSFRNQQKETDTADCHFEGGTSEKSVTKHQNSDRFLSSFGMTGGKKAHGSKLAAQNFKKENSTVIHSYVLLWREFINEGPAIRACEVLFD